MRSGRWSEGDREWVRVMARAGQVGVFLAVAIAVGWALGSWLDQRLGTEPWLTALFSLLGAAAGFLELFRVAMRLSRDE